MNIMLTSKLVRRVLRQKSKQQKKKKNKKWKKEISIKVTLDTKNNLKDAEVPHPASSCSHGKQKKNTEVSLKTWHTVGILNNKLLAGTA